MINQIWGTRHREPLFPFNDDVLCDECSEKGSYDINGDNLCEGCIKGHQEDYGNERE